MNVQNIELYTCTLEPIVGPEFWKTATEPRPLPPNVKTPAGRPKKKRITRNDNFKDPTKLSKVGTIVNCTYCKAQGHNARTCAAKKNDIVKKAAEQGTVHVIVKSTCVCKTCNKPGHNSRTCSIKQGGNSSTTTDVSREQDQQNISDMVQEHDRQGHGTQGSSTSGFATQAKKNTPNRKR